MSNWCMGCGMVIADGDLCGGCRSRPPAIDRDCKSPVCPACGDDGRTCEHRCFACDRIVEVGTCTNGHCETCCAEKCDGESPPF